MIQQGLKGTTDDFATTVLLSTGRPLESPLEWGSQTALLLINW
jgi:hypothetical protein